MEETAYRQCCGVTGRGRQCRRWQPAATCHQHAGATPSAPAPTRLTLSCCICLGEIESERAILGCAHAFHQKCIAQWAKHQQSCPYCRAPFEREEVFEEEYVPPVDVTAPPPRKRRPPRRAAARRGDARLLQMMVEGGTRGPP